MRTPFKVLWAFIIVLVVGSGIYAVLNQSEGTDGNASAMATSSTGSNDGVGSNSQRNSTAQAPVRADIQVVRDMLGDPSMPFASYSDRLMITAITDKVVVTDITINRGHCSNAGAQLPETLVYGQRIRLDPSCSVLEVTVDTDQGQWTMNFDQH